MSPPGNLGWRKRLETPKSRRHGANDGNLVVWGDIAFYERPKAISQGGLRAQTLIG